MEPSSPSPAPPSSSSPLPPPSSSEGQTKPNNPNALDLLMTTSKRRSSKSFTDSRKRNRPSSGGGSSNSTTTSSCSVQFIPCPAGCGQHIADLYHKMQQHYDRECSNVGGKAKARQNQDMQEESSSPPQPQQQRQQQSSSSSSASVATTPMLSMSLEKEACDHQQGIVSSSTTMEMATAQNTVHTPSTSAMLASPPSSNDASVAKEDVTSGTRESPSCQPTTNPDESDVCTRDATATGQASAGPRPLVSPEQQEKVQQKDIGPTIGAPSLLSSTCENDAPTNPYKGTNASKTVEKNKDATPNNAFAHMMKQSAKVFSSKSKSKGTPAADVHQHFVLEYNVNPNHNVDDPFSWNLHVDHSCTSVDQLTWDPPLWSTTVQVKDKYHDPPKIVALQLLATVKNGNAARNNNPYQNNPNTTRQQQQQHRWVRAHSRLSVPVLKSMLQKSIRRRRPMPAVRVAMELMDKAWGELVRRLPIIVLEDATLHPDLPLLVWIMVAHSRGFFTIAADSEAAEHDNSNPHHRNPHYPDMIQALQLRVLRIVFQVASCPYHDHPTIYDIDDGFESDENKGHCQPRLSDPFPKKSSSLQQQQNSRQQLQLSIWAMLVRAQYGGMACDVTMLQDFAKLWQERLIDDNESIAAVAVSDNGGSALHHQGRRHPIPEALASSMMPIPAELASSMMTKGDPTTTLWSNVPLQIHTNGIRQSIGRLPSNSNFVLDKMFFADICKEGVDFHCSNLVDVLLRDAVVVDACRDTMEKMGKSQNSITHEQLLKGAIWKFSAGVNLRRPLVILSEEAEETGNNGRGDADPMQSFWKDCIDPRVASFQTKYLKERLR